MEESKNTQDLTAEGFTFYTETDAELARLERKKIKYMEAKMDYSHPESILRIYDKTVHERIFKTPVGLFYLKRIQDFLKKQGSVAPDRIAPIPLYQTFAGEIRETQNPARNRVKPSVKKKKKSAALPVSILINILMAAAIIAMFFISVNADQPNVLNYEKVITNRYASWEQELTEREQVVREKEREFNITNEK